jgi:hypothetical protein
MDEKVGSRQEMRFSHHRADQTLNVSSKARLPRRPKSDLDPTFLTAAL